MTASQRQASSSSPRKPTSGFSGGNIGSHFDRYFAPDIAVTPQELESVYQLRHEVYCEELGFEEQRDDHREMDIYDQFSEYIVINHKTTNRAAGTVRLVIPGQYNHMPFEDHILDSLKVKELDPRNLQRDKICEFSRLVSAPMFRRRKGDHYQGAAIGNLDGLSKNEVRCFPLVAMSIYLSAVVYCEHREFEHAFIVTEPRIARSIAMTGIQFTQVSDVVNYHGKRALFHIEPPSVRKTVNAQFRPLLYKLDSRLNEILDGATMAHKHAENTIQMLSRV